MNINLNGSIGYTLLTNNKNNILILSDNHSELPYCDNQSGIFVSDWMQSKKKSIILLEEVPRSGSKLKELWTSSIHTQKLKNLYLNNNNIYIKGIDIRPFLLPYSWELINETTVEDMTLRNYFSLINDFYQVKHDYFIKNLKNIYTKEYLDNSKLGKHFLEIKNDVQKYVKKNKSDLKKKISVIFKTDKELLEKINIFTSNIMEWYMVAKIIQISNKLDNISNNFIVHAGLVHTSNLNNLLLNKYDYKLNNSDGSYSMETSNINSNGCLKLPVTINNQFGGFDIN